MTQKKINNFLIEIDKMLSNLSIEETSRLYEVCGAFIKNLAQPAPPPAHETIRIPVTIGDREYMACGFLKDGEQYITTMEFCERAGRMEGTSPVKISELEYIVKNIKTLNVPELTKYFLITEAYSMEHPHLPHLTFFYPLTTYGVWCRNSVSNENEKHGGYLLLRRCK